MISLAIVFSLLVIGSQPLVPPARGQGVPELRYGPLILGRSTLQQAQTFFGDPLSCVAPPAFQRAGVLVNTCVSLRHEVAGFPAVLIVNGVLRQIVLLFPSTPMLSAPAAVARLSAVYGPPQRLATGTGSAAGLRYWTFGASDAVLLTELRERTSGTQYLRLAITDRSGGWYPLVAAPPSPTPGAVGPSVIPRVQ